MLRSRLAPALRWLAPSAVAACAGALAAGLVEARHASGLLAGAAAAGFVALIATPVLLAGAAGARGVIRAWQPRALAAALVEDGGAAPRLAGWLLVVWLGALGLAAAMFQTVWALSRYTAWKPLTASFLAPMAAVATALAIVAASRPCARLFAHLARTVDNRWRRAGRRTLLSPSRIVGAMVVLAIATLFALWRLVIAPALGPIDTEPVHAPAAGLIVTCAAHAWPPGRPRTAIGLALAAATLAVIAAALASAWLRPALALELWGDRPVAGLAVETVFDLGAIRDRMPLSRFRPAARPGAAHPDVVLVTIDTVRADHTPPYGGRAEMPVLGQLAARGAVFDRALAPSNVTRRSIPSIVIGLGPDRVRGRVIGWALRLDPRHVVLAERLRAAGYDTAGFMCCEGFWGKTFHTGLERGLAHLEIEPRGAALGQSARAWLAERERKPAAAPLFVWMHVLEPHNWPEGAGEAHPGDDHHAAYDRALAAADRIVGDMLGAFTARPPDRMPIVIVTADHGESLGEHGHPYHSTDLYDAQIRVPLVIAGPGIAPRRVAEAVSLTGMVPTILELAGYVAPGDLDAGPFADLATGRRAGQADAGLAFAAMIKDRSNPGGITAVNRGRWKLIDDNDRLELYDTGSDPGERNSVIDQHPRIAGELRQLLVARAAAAARPPP